MDILKYGKENFKTEVLEECDINILDEREIYWIGYYHSNTTQYGYNLTKGGNGIRGEDNRHSIITEKDIINIFKLYSKGFHISQIQQEYYPDVSYTCISDVIHRRSWDWVEIPKQYTDKPRKLNKLENHENNRKLPKELEEKIADLHKKHHKTVDIYDELNLSKYYKLSGLYGFIHRLECNNA